MRDRAARADSEAERREFSPPLCRRRQEHSQRVPEVGRPPDDDGAWWWAGLDVA